MIRSPVVGSGPGTPGDEYVAVQVGSEVVTAAVSPQVRVSKLGEVAVDTGVQGPSVTGGTGIGPEHELIRSNGYVADVFPGTQVAGSAGTLFRVTGVQVIVDNGDATIAAAQLAAET